MTCIVAYNNGKNVIMGTDSLAVADGGETNLPPVNKIFRVHKDIIIGIAGESVIANLMGFVLKFTPPPKNTKNYTKYVFETVSLPLKDYLENQLNKKDSVFAALIAFKGGKLFEIISDFDVNELPSGRFHSIGSGAPYAFGAWHALKIREMETATFPPVKSKLLTTLNAAEYYNNMVRAPFFFEEI